MEVGLVMSLGINLEKLQWGHDKIVMEVDLPVTRIDFVVDASMGP